TSSFPTSTSSATAPPTGRRSAAPSSSSACGPTAQTPSTFPASTRSSNISSDMPAPVTSSSQWEPAMWGSSPVCLFDDLLSRQSKASGPSDNGQFVRRGVPLAPFTWFKLGGPAEYFVEPRTPEELAEVIRRCSESNTPLRFLGHGANLIVRDEGV